MTDRRVRKWTACALALVVPALTIPVQAQRSVLRVSAAQSTDPDVPSFTTVDAAVEAARTRNDALILVDPGEYDVNAHFTGSVEIRSATLGAGSLQPFDWWSCSNTASPTTVDVTLNIPPSGIRVATPGEGKVTLAGVVIQATGPRGIDVVAGDLVLRNSKMAGRLTLDSPAASASLSQVDMASGPGSGPWTAAQSVDPVGSLGLPFRSNDCDLGVISVTNGADFKARYLEVANQPAIGVCVDAAKALMCGGSIHDIRVSGDGDYGRGANVLRGGQLELRGVHIYDVSEAGLAVTGGGSTASLNSGTRIERVETTAFASVGVGVAGQSGATVQVQDSRVESARGPALFLSKAASAGVARSVFSLNQGAGVVAFGSTLTMSQTTIEKTEPHRTVGEVAGVLIDHVALGPSTATFTGCTVQDNVLNGVWVNGDGGSTTVTGSMILRSRLDRDNLHGNGVFAHDVCSGLTLTHNRFIGNADAQVRLTGSNATFGGNTYTPNGVLDFLQEECGQPCVSALAEADLSIDGLSSSTHTLSLCPRYDKLYRDVPTDWFSLVEVTIEQ